MANELLHLNGSQVEVGSNSTTIASNAGPTVVGSLAASQMLSYPLGDFVLEAAAAAAVAGNGVIMLYQRRLNVDGTLDGLTPSGLVSYSHKLVGRFLFPYSSASHAANQILTCDGVPLPAGDVEYYIDNNTNATIAGGWVLKVTPRTYQPGA